VTREPGAWIRVVACSAMAAARLLELAHSRRNMRGGGVLVEGQWSARTYPLMVALHTVVIAVTVLRGAHKPSWAWLTTLVGVQPIRLWVLLLLGRRWNTRGAVPTSLHVETRGPYAVIRHPNYVVVAIELLALPLSFGLPRLAGVAMIANGALMVPRILEEERRLMLIPAWRQHFADKPRFLPRHPLEWR